MLFHASIQHQMRGSTVLQSLALDLPRSDMLRSVPFWLKVESESVHLIERSSLSGICHEN